MGFKKKESKGILLKVLIVVIASFLFFNLINLGNNQKFDIWEDINGDNIDDSTNLDRDDWDLRFSIHGTLDSENHNPNMESSNETTEEIEDEFIQFSLVFRAVGSIMQLIAIFVFLSKNNKILMRKTPTSKLIA